MKNSAISDKEFLRNTTQLADSIELSSAEFKLSLAEAVCALLERQKQITDNDILEKLEQMKPSEKEREKGISPDLLPQQHERVYLHLQEDDQQPSQPQQSHKDLACWPTDRPHQTL